MLLVMIRCFWTVYCFDLDLFWNIRTVNLCWSTQCTSHLWRVPVFRWFSIRQHFAYAACLECFKWEKDHLGGLAVEKLSPDQLVEEVNPCYEIIFFMLLCDGIVLNQENFDEWWQMTVWPEQYPLLTITCEIIVIEYSLVSEKRTSILKMSESAGNLPHKFFIFFLLGFNSRAHD